MWDGLALIKRDSTNFVNESAITGGNPVLAFGKDSSKVLFEDMLGSTVGSVEGGKFNAINRTSFGELESGDSGVDFFTGKPNVSGLGYAFLFRNYRSDQGKWQTADPMGYPDGWNNLAYCNNNVTMYIDWQGAGWVVVSDNYNSIIKDPIVGGWGHSLLYPEWMVRTTIKYLEKNMSTGPTTTTYSVDGKTRTETITYTFDEATQEIDDYKDADGILVYTYENPVSNYTTV
ncbi:MAG: RHS repeat-associated core domain-containing protein, partial [Paludibacteraceae bacterium]